MLEVISGQVIFPDKMTLDEKMEELYAENEELKAKIKEIEAAAAAEAETE